MKRFESICGNHILSGLEIVKTKNIKDDIGKVIFTLDGVTYTVTGDYNLYNEKTCCSELKICNSDITYQFKEIEVVCYMMEDTDEWRYDCLIIKLKNNPYTLLNDTILEVGVKDCDGLYPYFYLYENISMLKLLNM